MKIFVLLVFVWLVAACSQLAVDRETAARPMSQSNAVESLYREGLQHKQSGDWRAAQASFERALRIEPNSAALWFELAQLAFEQDEFAEARALALRAQTFVGDDAPLERKIHKLLKRVSD